MGMPLMFVQWEQHGRIIATHVEAVAIRDLLLVGVTRGFDAQSVTAGGTAVQSRVGILVLEFPVEAIEVLALLERAVPIALVVCIEAAVVFRLQGSPSTRRS